MAEAVRIEAPAKINLRLRILAREESGYHSLETIFCAVSLCDELIVRPGAPGIRLSVDGGIDVGPPERNLCVRAADAFFRAVGREPAIELHLTKRIPAAAGLGGGSSDAAATLRALSHLHGEPLPGDALLQIGSEIGSDVPFFLCGSALALAWGRGERLFPLSPLPPRPVLIAHPGAAVPTAEAFRALARQRGTATVPHSFAFPPASLGSWDGVAAVAENDFEPVVFERIPRLPQAKRVMREAGAEIVLLAGSGGSIFGLFTEAAARDAAAKRLGDAAWANWRVDTIGALPEPRPAEAVSAG